MKIVTQIDENIMIAEILRAEIASPRWQKSIINVLHDKGWNKSILENPNTSNTTDNEKRKEILAQVRGYGKDTHLFAQFPNDIIWYRAVLTKEELQRVLYLNDEYWLNVTDKTRNPRVFVNKIKKELIPIDSKIAEIKKMALQIHQGKKYPSLIIVSHTRMSKRILLEGHFRLSSLMLSLDSISSEIEIIVGISSSMQLWRYY